MVTLARRVERVPFAPVAATFFAVAAAILVAATPQAMFEQAIAATGMPAVLPFAAPPLGLTARLLAIAIAAGAMFVVAWAVLRAVERTLIAPRPRGEWHDEGYALAERDRIEAAAVPRRGPIFADAELGAPLMSDAALKSDVAPEAESSDIDVLAAPLALDEFELTEVEEPTPGERESIASLIARLEAGLAARGDGDGPGSRGAPPPLTLAPEWMLPGEGDDDLPDDDLPLRLRQAAE